MANCVAIAGLLINLAGVVLLVRYGMPYRVETGGLEFIVTETVNQDEIRLEKLHKKLGFLGLLLIGSGTGLQVLALL